MSIRTFELSRRPYVSVRVIQCDAHVQGDSCDEELAIEDRTPDEARHFSTSKGWARHQFADDSRLRDYCPKHVVKFKLTVLPPTIRPAKRGPR